MGGRAVIDRLPGRPLLAVLPLAVRQRISREWVGSPPHRLLLGMGGRPEGFLAEPRDLRPADPVAGARVLSGVFLLQGETLAPGERGDPWDRPSPSRRFATALHRFDWMRDLLAAGPEGPTEALRLALGWSRVFGRWNAFAWSPAVLERRVFNLACAGRAISARASDVEAARLAASLARQARRLLQIDEGPHRAAERAAVAAVAGTALSGKAGDRLLAAGLARLRRVLPATVTPDGGHASRSPQAALELFFDLSTLDEVLSQRGLSTPEEVLRALDRLSGAIRFFTLGDGRLAAFHGGRPLDRAYVAAARAQDEFGERPVPVARNGYQRLDARGLQVFVDASPAAAGAWSVNACAQPLAIEVLTGDRRLIAGCGWSPDVEAPPALRLVDGASTASIADSTLGEPLRGFLASVLGPRLTGALPHVTAQRHETPAALWLELAHDGWIARCGLRHERRLYVNKEADELRGEDRFVPTGGKVSWARKFAPFAVRFHLPPDVQAQVVGDGRSVLLRPDGGPGWWLRNDAAEVTLEPSICLTDGTGRRSQQVVLRGQARMTTGARLRWKLTPATRVDAGPPEP